MKCNKTILAVAIAGIAAAPMIASADTTLSGAVEIQLTGSDVDDVDAVADDPLTPEDETTAASSPGDARIAADDVLFGIVSEHALNSGLTGYGSLRVDINRLSNEGRSTIDPGTPGNDEDDIEVTTLGSADSVYVGFKGGFGDLRFGETFNPAEKGQVANDIFDVTGDINGGIGYSGSFGPVGLQVAVAPEQNEDVVAAGISFGLGGFSIGAGAEDRADVQAASVGASFAFAGASVAANFWTREGDDDAGGDVESFTVKVGYGFGGVSANLTFAVQTNDDDSTDQEAVRLDLSYGLGGGMTVSSRITAASDNNNSAADNTSWRIKLGKAF